MIAPPTSSKLPEVARLLDKKLPLDKGQKQQLLSIVKQTPAEDLSHILASIDTHRLFQKMGNHHLDRASKLDLLNVLCHDRLPEISLENRLRLVDGLQFGRTDADDEAGIRDIFLATSGSDLTRLKNGIDGGGDYHDLQELLFHDIDSQQIRSQILRHIATQAKEVSGSEVKSLSDIDDTFYVNWSDESYPKKTVYPGVVEFYQELDRGADGKGRPGDKVFVTARPRERTGTVKDEIIKSVAKRGIPDATILAGDITHFVGSDRIAEMKYKNFTDYRQLYPEYPFVWTGDSGQGDVQFAQAMLNTPGGNLKAAFIHDVVKGGQSKTSPAQREEYRRQGIVFFDTYLGAGLEAYQRNLIHQDGMARIALGAIARFPSIKFDSPTQEQARKAELLRDLERVNQQLPPDKQVHWQLQ